MSDAAIQARSPAPDALNRRLAAGLLVSLLVHGLVLSLQFGVPELALPGLRSAISVVLVQPPAPEPVPDTATPQPVPPAPVAAQRSPAFGMTLIDPVQQPKSAVPPPKKPVKRNKPRKARRVSPPLPAPVPDTLTRVIAQDHKMENDFTVPLPQPQEAELKTIDPAEAQHGVDEPVAFAEGEVHLPATDASVPAERDAQDRLVAQRYEEERLAAERERESARQEQLAAEAREREAALAEQRARDQAIERQNAEQLLAEQSRLQELVERQKAEQLLAEQHRMRELAERRKAEQLLAEQGRMQELAERQRNEDLLAEQRRAHELAERRRLEELAARRLAEEGARRQAVQDAARERELAQSNGAPAADPFGSPVGEGSGGHDAPPASVHGGSLANRVRELSKGLDLLRGTPPVQPRDNEAARRRAMADSAERDVPLRMYVESWRQKIERNGGMNFPKLLGDRARIDPVVSVAVRSDGSIEDVTIVRSSGRADTDEAVRRIVRINALYSRFPPNVASRYDVIEIRRIWIFDQVLKLIEEVR